MSTDSGDSLPDTFAEFAQPECLECGEAADRWDLTDGLCASCLMDAEVAR